MPLLTINVNLFKQRDINQMFDKIQMILMMKTSISNNRISRLKKKYKCLSEMKCLVYTVLCLVLRH